MRADGVEISELTHPELPAMLDYEAVQRKSEEPRLTKVMGAIVAVFLIFGCVLAPCSGLAFDAPGSDKQPATCLFVYSSMGMPFSGFAGIFVSRFFAKQDRPGFAAVVLLVPLLNGLLVAIAIAWIWGRGGGFR